MFSSQANRWRLHTVQRLIINFNFKLRWMAVEHRKHTFQYKHMHSNGVQQVETSDQESVDEHLSSKAQYALLSEANRKQWMYTSHRDCGKWRISAPWFSALQVCWRLCNHKCGLFNLALRRDLPLGTTGVGGCWDSGWWTGKVFKYSWFCPFNCLEPKWTVTLTAHFTAHEIHSSFRAVHFPQYFNRCTGVCVRVCVCVSAVLPLVAGRYRKLTTILLPLAALSTVWA